MDQPLDDDLSLISRVAVGDQQAAEVFDGRFRPLLLRFLHGRIPTQDQCDIVQEVLLAAFQSIRKDGFRGASTAGTWLVGILKHKVADYWESHGRDERALVSIQTLPLSTTASPLDLVPDRHSSPETAIEISQLLQSLPKKHRVILILNLRERWTTEEIAAAMKMPPGTIGRILWEAKRMLQKQRPNVKKLPEATDQ